MSPNIKSPSESLGFRLLRWLSALVFQYPRGCIYSQFFLFAVSVLITIGPARINAWLRGEKAPTDGWLAGVQFDIDRNNLVGADKKYHQNFLQFQKEFPTQDDLVVVVESETPEKNRQFVERLGAKLEQESNLFVNLIYKGDLQMLGRKGLLFASQSELQELQKTMQDFRPFLGQFTRATNLASLFSLINTQFRTARAEQNAENKALMRALPALEKIIVQGTAAMQNPGSPPSPGLAALFGADEAAAGKMYVTFDQGRIYLLAVQAETAAQNEKALRRLRQLVLETQSEVPGVNVGLTGEPVLELDEMVQSQSDSLKASVISLVACALIFIVGYRQTGRPLKAVFCLVVGLGYTMAFTTLAIGHLNILTVTFAPILIGLAIDFGVHLITRYEEELRQGQESKPALEKAIIYTGLGIFTGALTTAGAFFAMAGTSFKGIQEMGVICGGGLLLCLIPMMTLLPVLLLRGRQNDIDRKSHSEMIDHRVRMEKLWLERPKWIVAITVGIGVLSALQFPKVYFDYNLLNMQSHGLPAVEFEKRLIHSSQSVLFAVVVAHTAEEARHLQGQIEKLTNCVAKVESMVRYLGDDQEKLALVNEIKRDVSNIHFAEMDTQPVDLPELTQILWSTAGYLGWAINLTQKEEPALARQLASLRAAITAFRATAWSGETDVAQRLKKFQQVLFRDIHHTFQTLQTQDGSSGLRPQDLPLTLRHRFIGVTGKHLLQVYPRKNIWQREYQKEFVHELRRTLHPGGNEKSIITGTPVQLFEYTTLLKDSYVEAAWYALAAIALLIFSHFRSITCVILALLPVGIGMIWLMGLMGAFGLPFNPANIMTLPLVIGIGVTNGIHILNRFSEEQNPSILAKSTGKAVFVSGLTTIAGFGSLIFAQHQGIASLGLMMTIGVSTCMMAGLTFLPALLTLLIKRGWTIKKPSGGMHKPALGSEEPR